MNKELIEDLRLNHEYCPKEVLLQAADAIEALQARCMALDVSDLEAQLMRHTALVNELQGERCKLQARVVELDADRNAADELARSRRDERDLLAKTNTDNIKLINKLVAERDSLKAACDKFSEDELLHPVGYVYWNKGHAEGALDVQTLKAGAPLYAAPVPPVREPLSDERIIQIAVDTMSAEPGRDGYVLPVTFARAIEAAHGIKEQK